MKISAKGRYGLAAMTHLAQNHASGSPITIISIADKLGISKIYLEQVFSLLKRANLVVSLKGSQGGYRLIAEPNKITIYSILSAIELSLIEKTAATVAEKAPAISAALQNCVFTVIDQTLQENLTKITLFDLVIESEKHAEHVDFMYFI